MRGYRGGVGGALAIAAAMAMAGCGGAPEIRAVAVEEQAPRPARKPVKRSYLAQAPVKYRNRWKPAKPRRRPNRLHISRRARRRHRRRA